jgi:hypothetical protein
VVIKPLQSQNIVLNSPLAKFLKSNCSNLYFAGLPVLDFTFCLMRDSKILTICKEFPHEKASIGIVGASAPLCATSPSGDEADTLGNQARQPIHFERDFDGPPSCKSRGILNHVLGVGRRLTTTNFVGVNRATIW